MAIIIVLGFVLRVIANMANLFTLNDIFAFESYVFSMIMNRQVINLCA
jgi:uncharacterized membrane protein